jgi:thymidylate synthase (FAD)
MEVKLTMSTPEIAIGENAKICYGTKQFENGGKDITATMVHDFKHLASLRFAYATFTVEGISVACQNQMVRSAHLSFMVQSKRYVNADKGEFEFIMPENLEGEFPDVVQDHFDKTLILYKQLLDRGVKKEDARAILPANTSTKMNISGNLQGWDSMFKLRLKPSAQLEIRTLAGLIYDELSVVFPNVFTAEYKLKLQEK